MIRRLLLRWFSRHDRFEVDLEPVTVFVGPSGTGKTAILRAVRWLFTNRPLGTRFVGRWRAAPYAFAKAWLDDGRTVSRARGKGVNEYRLDGKTLKAMGSGVPRPVADLVNVGDVNFAGQHEGPFWFLLSPAEVGRRLNSIVNLSSIDDCLSAAAREVRTLKVSVDVCKERLKAARADRDGTEWAISFHDAVIHAESQFGQAADTASRARSLAFLLDQAADLAEDHKVASDAAVDAANAVSKYRAWQTTAERADRLAVLLDDHDRLAATAGRRLPDSGPLRKLLDALAETERRRQNLRAIVTGYESLTWELDESEAAVADCHDRIGKMKGKPCRECGRPLDSSVPTGTCRTGSRPPVEKSVRTGMSPREGRSGGSRR